MLDASAPYCQELRRDKPEFYMDVCETMDGWRARDPGSFARRGERERSAGLMDVILDIAVDETVDAVASELD